MANTLFSIFNLAILTAIAGLYGWPMESNLWMESGKADDDDDDTCNKILFF